MPQKIASDWGLPGWLNQLLATVAVNPVGTAVPSGGEPVLRSIGKPISELLGRVFTPTAKGTGLPSELTLSNWDARTGNVQFHGNSQAAAPVFEATPAQIDQLINGGALDLQQPPASLVGPIQARLRRALGGQ